VSEEDIMSLPACQQRTLTIMDYALEATEPRLSAMFAMFAHLAKSEPIRAEQLSRRRPIRLRSGRWPMLFPALTGIALVVGLIVSQVTSPAPGCASAVAAPPARGTAVSCVAPDLHQTGAGGHVASRPR
jgi:hypothetical protein